MEGKGRCGRRENENNPVCRRRGSEFSFVLKRFEDVRTDSRLLLVVRELYDCVYRCERDFAV